MLPISALSALLAASLSIDLATAHGPHGHAHLHKRQLVAAASSSSSAAASTGATAAPASSSAAAASAPAGTGSYDVPPLASITSGMPAGATPTLTTTFTPGAVPSLSGAPPLPSACTFSSAILHPIHTLTSNAPKSCTTPLTGPLWTSSRRLVRVVSLLSRCLSLRACRAALTGKICRLSPGAGVAEGARRRRHSGYLSHRRR